MMKFVVAGLLALLSTTFPSQAAAEDFSGDWSPDGTDSAIRYIRIAPGGGNTLILRVYGDCLPHTCLWGVATARPEDPATAPDKVTGVSATIYYAYARRTITLRLAKEKITFTAHYHFAPKAGTDKTETGVLSRSLWPAPWQQGSWELRQGDNAGWGGGVQGFALAPAKEVCQSFDLRKAELHKTGQSWQAAAEGVRLFSTRWPEEMARDALLQLTHSGVNQKCESGGITYWQKNGIPPRYQPHDSRACIKFSPTTTHIARIGENWILVDGDLQIFNTHHNKENAYALLSVIRHRDFSHKCVFAWPNPILTLWFRD